MGKNTKKGNPIFKTFKYRIYPTKEQKEYFSKTFGCVRFIYNRMLADKIKHYEETKQNLRNTPSQYKNEFPWLKEVDSTALSNAQINLEKAYRNFFRNKGAGFPKFKTKKTNKNSYTAYKSPIYRTIYIENSHIKLPKLISLVKIKQHRTFNGNIKSCTISQAPSGKYFASVLVECEINKFPKLNTKVGIDLGIKTFATMSDGKVVENPKHLKKSEKRLIKLQKDFTRKQKGSNNRNKARIKVATLHEKITNQRADFLHKVSSKIINENQVIVLEDLIIKEIVKNTNMSKEIYEIAWRKFRAMIEYKAKWYGRDVIIAFPHYASSQLCSNCGNQSSQTKDLACRIYKCPKCGLEINRDYNASLNLLKLAT